MSKKKEHVMAAPLSASEAQGICSLCPTCGGCRKGHIHCRKCSCVVHSDAMPPEEKEAQRRSFAYGNSNISNGAVTREMVNQEAENMPHVHDPRPMRYGMACAECGEILEAAAAPLSQAQSPAPRDAQNDTAVVPNSLMWRTKADLVDLYKANLAELTALRARAESCESCEDWKQNYLSASRRANKAEADLRARAAAPEGLETFYALSQALEALRKIAELEHAPSRAIARAALAEGSKPASVEPGAEQGGKS